ncbi:MAG: DNA methylase [Planctomycetales bacterium]
MANSPAHRFGQIIGDVLEAALKAPLAKVAKRRRLYLDYQSPRPARQGNSKVCWCDLKGNRHDLDYVLEAGGTDAIFGRPKAFIEIAYRRYTKHSRNKAQEIQGAITPLFETYAHDHPFIGVVLAGVFTEGSLAQLRSHGFGVHYLPFESIVKAFRVIGIDAHFDEQSADSEIQQKVDAWSRLPDAATTKVGAALRKIETRRFQAFVAELDKALSRTIRSVHVLALSGQGHELVSVDSAIQFIEQFDEANTHGGFVRYEVNIRYTNNDEIRGSFASKVEAIKFLHALA